MATRAGSARERLLGAAARLFYANGVAATGIDAIITEAGVAKMSLYNNFASTDEAAGLAEHLAFVLEGAVSRAGLEGRSERLLHARSIAETLMAGS
jgi:AcrR family transcriptional regulator